MSETKGWQEQLELLAGQAHSACVAVAAYVTGVEYHDSADLETCNGPSCLWYRELRDRILAALNSQEQHAWPFTEPESKWTKDQWRQLAILARTSKERLEAQVQQLQAERDEAIRGLAIARYAPVGDNHHNAASCPYCRSWYDAVIDANASLNDTNAALQAENAALRKALAEIRAVYKRPNSSMRLSAKVMDLTAAAALKAASPEVGE